MTTEAASLSMHFQPGFVKVRALPEIAPRARVRRSVAAETPPEPACAKIFAAEPLPSSPQARIAQAQRRAPAKHKRTDAIEYRLIFGAAFVVFLITAALERALPLRALTGAGASDVRKPVIEQAKEAANISATYAFMG